MRQVAAVLQFDGKKYYSDVDPKECRFVHGHDDRIFNKIHVNGLKKLVPQAEHEVINELGHMVNIEKPELFKI